MFPAYQAFTIWQHKQVSKLTIRKRQSIFITYQGGHTVEGLQFSIELMGNQMEVGGGGLGRKRM